MSVTQTPRQAARTTWKIDPAHTTVEFSAKHMMITTVRGRLGEVEGTIETDEEHPECSTVQVTIAAASIDTRNEQRDAHLRSGDFLDVEHYPSITFRSTRIEGGKDHFRLTGDLAIRGRSRPVTLDVRFEGRSKDPWGGERAGFSATTTIDRREWGLMWNQALEAGGVLVGNELRLSIDVQAVKQS